MKRHCYRPALPARRSPWAVRAFQHYAGYLLRGAFFRILVRHADVVFRVPHWQPLVCFANHVTWWDGLLNFYLMQHLLPNRPFFIMVEELYRFQWLSLLGAFSVEKSSPLHAKASLDYALELLAQHPTAVLWLYPQGAVFPEGRRPLGFSQGVGYLASRLPNACFLPVAQHYAFFRENRPEIMVAFGQPLDFSWPWPRDDKRCRREATRAAEAAVSSLLAQLAQDATDETLDAYGCLLRGRENPFKAWEKRLSIWFPQVVKAKVPTDTINIRPLAPSRPHWPDSTKPTTPPSETGATPSAAPSLTQSPGPAASSPYPSPH